MFNQFSDYLEARQSSRLERLTVRLSAARERSLLAAGEAECEAFNGDAYLESLLRKLAVFEESFGTARLDRARLARSLKSAR